jgi:hypothetical protein
MLQHFIIEGRYLGSVERKFDLTRGASPLSYGFFCMGCGEVFAKCPVEGRPWQFWARTCRKCPGGATLGLPGSIDLSWDKEFTAAFPFAVLLWEFQCELEQYDKDNEDGQS